MSDRLKILILRLSSAGDIIHGLPVAAALKDNIKDCYISWLVEDRFKDLLVNNPAVDDIQIVPRIEWKGWSLWAKARESGRIVRRLRTYDFDISLDLQGLTKSSLAGKLSGINKRIGFAGYEGKEISQRLNNITFEAEGTHIVERNLSLLRALDIENPAVRFPLPDLNSEKINNFLAENKLEKGRFMILNPGAGWGAKLWTVERFAETAIQLLQDSTFPIVITWGGGKEKKMAEDINELTGGKCIQAPPTTLSELWSLLSCSGFYLGLDTGPTHMAAAAGVPTLALFGPTSGERNGPFGAEICEFIAGKCHQHPLCWKKKYRESCTCMLQISAENVIERCRNIITRLN